MLFAAAIPHSYLLYPMIWNDACSDEFFQAIEMSITWIASLNAIESSAFTGLGYIDYQTKSQKDQSLVYVFRKKRLAFGKLALIMAIITLVMLDKPSPNCVIPILLGSIWNIGKFGTHVSYNLTPTKFFFGRSFLTLYNIAFLLVIWYKLRQGRKQKLDLEYQFFDRIETVMGRMSSAFED